TVKLFVQDSIKDNSLSDAYRYLIVPDLHGEVSVLNSLVDQYGDDPEMKFIFLGDIVDRGESSFETFRLVHRLIKSGKGHGVVSNHDNKAYRWFGKWLKDGDHKYKTETFDTYGMKVAYGLGKTLTEFHSLEPNHRKTYAEDFVEYYENLNPYLRLELPDAVHFFSHAGITRDVLKGMRVMRKDMAHLLYETLKEEHVYEDNHLNIDDNVVIHLGHDTYMEAPLIVFQDDTTKIWKHDFGLGKIDLHLPLPDHRFEIV
ncbi:MAG: metallophosphoesterase, partial [Gammaproteobacteria bacterium]|nr:metallophosphoesterase [Gammaproteobacteria bacterium]